MSGATLAISAGLAAAGAGVSAYSNNQNMRKQDRDAAAGIIKQGQLQRQGDADVQKNIAQAKNNAEMNAKNQQGQEAQYAAALQRARPTQDSSFTVAPGASSRYAADVGKAIQGNQQFGANQAKSLSITDAPMLTKG